MPELLTLELLERLERTLRGLGAAIVDHWQPGLTREQVDALTEPHGFLYRRGAGRVGDTRSSHGTFRFPARALKPGKYEVRVTPAASTGFARAKSASLVIPRR